MTHRPLSFFFSLLSIGEDDGIRGADLGASAAFDAGIGVDNIDVAFRDSVDRAVGEAGAAGHTFVGDYVSHCFLV